MRITLINQFYRPDISPTAHLTASLAEDRAARGDTVTVVTSRGGYVAASKVENSTHDNPHIFRIWTPRLGKKNILSRIVDYATFYLLTAWRMLRLPRQDLIISLTTPPYIAWTGLLHKFLHPSTRIVLWNMDCYPDAAERAGVLRKFGFASRIMRALNRALFRRLDHLVCLDQAMVDLLLSQYGPKDRTLPTTIIPNWERGDLFPPGQSHPPWDQIQSLGLHDRLIVLYLGNAGVGHPFETVMEAAKVLRDEPITFLFVGGGKRWPWLQQAKQQHDLDSLVFCDYIQKESTPSVMQAAGCALITLGSDMLGVMSPSKLHSNLAMHLPILYVGPQTSNVDEAISRYSCGVSLREGDSDGIVKFLRSLLADKALHAGLRQRARNAFDMAYSDCRTLPQWHSVIQQFK